jgi:hypothetical protein
MKPKGTINIKTRRRSHGSGTLMASLQAPLSKAKSLEIFHSLRWRSLQVYSFWKWLSAQKRGLGRGRVSGSACSGLALHCSNPKSLTISAFLWLPAGCCCFQGSATLVNGGRDLLLDRRDSRERMAQRGHELSETRGSYVTVAQMLFRFSQAYTCCALVDGRYGIMSSWQP